MMTQGEDNMKKWFMLVTLVFVMVVAGEFWRVGATSAAPTTLVNPRTLRMMVPKEPSPTSLNPLVAHTGIGSFDIFLNTVEPLLDLGKKGEPVPKLATKWESSPDLTKWRFYLRRGVKFHNGDNFTARDVVELARWSYEAKNLSRLYAVMPIERAVAVDDYTVDFFFEKPQPLLLISLPQMLIWPAAVNIDTRKTVETHVIGTGPYKMAEWNLGRNIVFAKFEGYWGPKPKIDKVEITFRGEESVRMAALQAGEVDWVSGVAPDLAVLAPKVVRIPGPQMVFIRFDEYIQKELGGVSVLADKRLRLAIEYAIDRNALVSLYGGLATVSLGQFASPGDFGFNPKLKNRPYDLEKAKALVREAGAVGKTVTLACEANVWSKDREVGEAVAFMIEQTGLKVKSMFLPRSEFIKYKQVLGERRKYNVDILVNPLDFILEVESYFPALFVEGGRFMATFDSEPKRLYQKVVAETDYARRGMSLGDAWAYVYEQAHYVPLFKLPLIWGLAKNLEWDTDISGRGLVADMSFTD